MNQIIAQLSQFFLQYPLKQRLIIIGVLIGFISTVISLVLWANRTEYELLYSNLEPEAASSIVSDLRNSKNKYRIEDGGTTIYAQKENISELRLKYAQSGYLKDASPGYEIFEKNTMGMTTFMQQLNLKRALEGELMRTINQFPEVKQSRVHLNIPENRLFEDKKNGSASIVLHLKPGAVMNKNQLNGISALVANSVESIDPKDVVILDSQGGVLFEGNKGDGVIGLVGNQYELQNSIDAQLQKKVIDLVEGIVGQKNTVVKVSTELNFDQIERTREEVDPDKVVVLSEEKYTETSKNSTDSSDLLIEKATTNYELSKTMEKYISNSGGIKRLTVAVLVNGRRQMKENGNGEKVTEYIPRSEQELRQIGALVKSAVGYSEERGDLVEVQNLPFDTTVEDSDQQFFAEQTRNELYEKLIVYGLLAIGLILGFFLLKGLLKTSISALAIPAPALAQVTGAGGAHSLAQKHTGGALPEAEEEISEDVYISKLSPEARAKLKAKDKMTDEVIRFAGNTPDSATKLLRTWLTKSEA